MPKNDYYLPGRQLVTQNQSAVIERANIPRSRFSGTWTRKTTFDAGGLYPIMIDEILPGDHMTYNVTAFVRMATVLFPIFDQQTINTFFFFVPARLLWENWHRFMGEQDNPADSIAFTVPTVSLVNADITIGSIYDHFGIPVTMLSGANDYTINALPLRAYNEIWNQWFRDENIQNSVIRNIDNGPDAPADYGILRRGKQHDYFTSMLPWPQKFTAPNVPMLGQAPITGLGAISTAQGDMASPTNVYETVVTGVPSAVAYQQGKLLWDPNVQNMVIAKQRDAGGGVFPLEIYADLTQATGVAINQLRQTFMIQTLLERDARGGTRYTELIRSHFGVVNPDFRLQRPEYIGGGSTPLAVTPIAQTATGGGGLGALGGAGTAAGRHQASYAATEHGYIIGLINVRTELSYGQGIHKLWTRSTRYDFYWPALAQLGEQSVLLREIYADGNETNDNIVIGYQERWHEYRTRYSEISGYFRSQIAGTLDAWHLGQRFTSAPSLNNTFIRDTPPVSRVLAAGAAADNQQYLADIMFHRSAVRPIPTFGTPATLGRF